MFANEIGFTIRNHAPLNVKKWKEVKPEDRTSLIKRITTKYDIDMSLSWVKRYVNKSFGTVFANFRYKLKKHFEQFSTKEEALENKHKDVKTEEEWAFLCTYFFSEDFQVRTRLFVYSFYFCYSCFSNTTLILLIISTFQFAF
ncbi:hypothetical protein RchiOBHm_Chr1g0345631 [Rosa chinensis]|uniref:Transposase, Ptta/En/Spm, plant n=1 Tax=Rosa chinensis TaxID=74649 RepID=A0A2P6SEV0_ROSCH|nr:hypothetical protein RchiOBHm_Chr1g0345631 [Rosa chinensis]